jgi:hypothetical protein
MEVNGQRHAPATLPPRKCPWYTSDRRLGGPQSRSGRCGEEKNLALLGIESGPSSPSYIEEKKKNAYIETSDLKILLGGTRE